MEIKRNDGVEDGDPTRWSSEVVFTFAHPIIARGAAILAALDPKATGQGRITLAKDHFAKIEGNAITFSEAGSEERYGGKEKYNFLVGQIEQCGRIAEEQARGVVMALVYEQRGLDSRLVTLEDAVTRLIARHEEERAALTFQVGRLTSQISDLQKGKKRLEDLIEHVNAKNAEDVEKLRHGITDRMDEIEGGMGMLELEVKFSQRGWWKRLMQWVARKALGQMLKDYRDPAAGCDFN